MKTDGCPTIMNDKDYQIILLVNPTISGHPDISELVLNLSINGNK